MIQSAQNSLIKKVDKLKEKKHRDKYGLFLVEGEKLVAEAVNWDIECLLLTESFAQSGRAEKYNVTAATYIIKEELMRKISDTVNPQGIAAVAMKKKHTKITDSENPFIVVCEKISDPGNLGAIIRTAHAAGASGLVLSKGSVDLYSPKTVRAAAGALFHLPVITDTDLSVYIPQAKEERIFFFGAHLKAEQYPYNMDLKSGCAFVIGNEANGLTDETTKLMDALVKLPMQRGAESLNAAVACGALIYEVVRQRITL